MQKKIVALAVAGLSTAAFAQTNVTIYGTADLSGQGISQSNVKDGQAAALGYNGGSVFALQSNSSFIGFKGTEDLGNGLKALFQYETGVNLAGQSTSANNTHPGAVNVGGSASGLWGGQRDTFIALSSKYGVISGGLLSTPMRASVISFAVEPGATGSMSIEKQMGSQRYGFANTTFSNSIRATAIAYSMPTLYGFDASIAYTGSNNNGTTNSSNIGSNSGEGVSATSATPQSVFGLNLGWTGYGVNIKGAFQQQNNNFTSTTSANLTNPNAIGDYTTYLVGAAYTGVPGLKVSAVYLRNTLGTNGVNTLTTGGAGKITNNQLYTGVGYRWGNWEPTVSATWSSDMDGSSVQQLGSRQWQLRTGYYLSKRTQVYGLISNLNNSANQNFTFGQQTSQLGANAQATGSNLFTYGMGMRTNF
jgi:predicted porin